MAVQDIPTNKLKDVVDMYTAMYISDIRINNGDYVINLANDALEMLFILRDRKGWDEEKKLRRIHKLYRMYQDDLRKAGIEIIAPKQVE